MNGLGGSKRKSCSGRLTVDSQKLKVRKSEETRQENQNPHLSRSAKDGAPETRTQAIWWPPAYSATQSVSVSQGKYLRTELRGTLVTSTSWARTYPKMNASCS